MSTAEERVKAGLVLGETMETVSAMIQQMNAPDARKEIDETTRLIQQWVDQYPKEAGEEAETLRRLYLCWISFTDNWNALLDLLNEFHPQIVARFNDHMANEQSEEKLG